MRRLTTLLLTSSLLVAGCSTSQKASDPLQVAATLEAASPATSPEQTGELRGSVVPLDAQVSGMAIERDTLVVTTGQSTLRYSLSGLRLLSTAPTSPVASPQQVITVGDRAVQLDRLRSAVFELSGDKVGAGLRAGDGATHAVADRYGRVLVTDTRGGELLIFSVNPLIMRQRFPVPGAPYGIAYDAQRDLAWITLTERNEVVGFNVAGGEPTEKYRFATVRQPNSVAADSNSGRVFVASADRGGIQVVSP